MTMCYAQKKSPKKSQKTEKQTSVAGLDFSFNQYFLEGNKCKNLGDYEGAIKNYTRALAVDETQSAAYYEIATILFASGDYSSATQYAEKAVAHDKTNNVAYLDLLIYTYTYSGLPEKTIPLFKKLISIKPTSVENYYELAKVYQKLNKPKDAIKILNQAESVLGIVDIISVQKEMIYEQMGDVEKSLEEMIRLRDAFPNNMRYKAMLAEAYYQHKKMDLAAKEFAELEKMPIKEGLVYLSVAEYHRAVDQKYNDYFIFLEKAFLCEDESLTYELKMQMLNQLLPLAQNDPLILVLTKRLVTIVDKQYPTTPSFSALKADLAMINKDYAEVRKNLMDIVAEDKSTYEIWESLMSFDLRLEDYDNLYIHSKEATELFPNILMTYQYYVLAAYLKEKFNEVIEAVNYASMLSVDNQEVMVDLLSMQGDSYHALKMYQQADSVYEYILYKDADYMPVLNNYSYNLSVRGEKLKRALELSSHLIELSPDNPTYIDTHAWVLYKNNMLDNALEFMNLAIEKDETYYVYFDHRGDILFSLGRIDEAVADWEKALSLISGDEKEEERIKIKINTKTLSK